MIWSGEQWCTRINDVRLNEKARENYMTLEDIIMYRADEAREEGREEGLLEGMIKVLLDIGTPPQKIIEQITSKYEYTEEEILKCMEAIQMHNK